MVLPKNTSYVSVITSSDNTSILKREKLIYSLIDQFLRLPNLLYNISHVLSLPFILALSLLPLQFLLRGVLYNIRDCSPFYPPRVTGRRWERGPYTRGPRLVRLPWHLALRHGGPNCVNHRDSQILLSQTSARYRPAVRCFEGRSKVTGCLRAARERSRGAIDPFDAKTRAVNGARRAGFTHIYRLTVLAERP